MLKIIIKGHHQELAVLNIARLFSAELKIVDIAKDGLQLYSEYRGQETRAILKHSLQLDGKELVNDQLCLEPNLALSQQKQLLKRAVYRVLSQYYQQFPPWGILVGVRPTKLFAKLLKSGLSKTEASKILAEEYLVSQEKISILSTISDLEREVGEAAKKSLSLYINIPFCPSRCLYCSFAAEVGRSKQALLKNYLLALITEIKESASYYRDYAVESIYFGGGTPSVLSPEQIDRIYRAIADNYNLSSLREFNFEAGRPKTVNHSLLAKLAEIGVDRISINPQTSKAETLQLIGRQHNFEAIVEAFHLARQYKFKTINADIIAGLYGEDLSDFQRTIKDVLALKPESITVHSLSQKKGSDFKLKRDKYSLPALAVVKEQMNYAQQMLSANNYHPYYLYRQKQIAANLENTGYSLTKHHSLYNMRIIQEKQTILAFGAGASNKFYNAESDSLDNFINIKDVRIYIERVEEMIVAKKKRAVGLLP